MYLSSIPYVFRRFLPSNLEWQVSTQRKELYLTFDDGPIPEVTPWVLEVLKQFQAQATFFCVGDNVRKNPEIFQQLLEQGHSIGNHSFNHLKAWKTPYHDYLENVGKCSELVNSPLFRPPHGQITHRLARELGKKYRLIMWTLLTRDFDKTISPYQCLQNALTKSKPGALIVFHDSLKAWPRLEFALPRYLEVMSQQGYSFKSL